MLCIEVLGIRNYLAEDQKRRALCNNLRGGVILLLGTSEGRSADKVFVSLQDCTPTYPGTILVKITPSAELFPEVLSDLALLAADCVQAALQKESLGIRGQSLDDGASAEHRGTDGSTALALWAHPGRQPTGALKENCSNGESPSTNGGAFLQGPLYLSTYDFQEGG